MAATERGGKDPAVMADEALDTLWKRCYEWHRMKCTQGIGELSVDAKCQKSAKTRQHGSAQQELTDMVGAQRLLTYVAEAWKVQREKNIGEAQRAHTVCSPEGAWSSLQLPWMVHVDANAQESFTTITPDLGIGALGRLLRHACGLRQGADLIAEEGDYTRIFETQCHGELHLFWGVCLRRKCKENGKKPLTTKPSSSTKLHEILRVFALAGPSSAMQRQARKEVAAFLSKPPQAQLPWHVFGPPLEFHSAPDSSSCAHTLLPHRDSLQIPTAWKASDKSRALCGLGSDDSELLRLADKDEIRHFLDIVGGDRLTEEEKVAGSAHGNSLLVGRSGTGKTTVAMLRLAALELLRAPTQPSAQAVFLTASPVLSREVLRSFKTLRQLPGLRRRLHGAGLLKARAALSRKHPPPQTAALQVQHDDANSAAVENTSLHDTGAESACVACTHNERVPDVPRGSSETQSFHAASLGSWLALEASPTEDSFEMVDAELYDIATIPTEEDEELLAGQINETLAEDLQEASCATPIEVLDVMTKDEEDSDEEASEHGGWAPLPGPRLPPALCMADSDDFPMFLTVRHLLHMIDAGLTQPFFARGNDLQPMDGDICTWQPEGGGVHLVNDWIGGMKWQPSAAGEACDEIDIDASDLLQGLQPPGGEVHSKKNKAASSVAPKRRMEVGYEYFAEVLWPSMGGYSKALEVEGFHPSLVWTEIMAHIKGSQEALASGQALTSQQYVGEFGQKRTPMTKQQRVRIYEFWSQYERLKRELCAFDEADFVWHIHKHLRAEGYAGPRIRCLVVDEVQDISQATLRLILHLVEPQKGGLLLCGDPAQTISKGLAFRLCDLRSAFVEGECISRHEAPDVLRLTTNFRSTASVLRLGNDVLAILRAYFPNSLDHGGQETAAGKEDGPKPTRASSLEDLMMDVTSGQPDSKAAFGADLVVLVREQSRKAAMPDLLRHCLVMTVWEAKGLEFDTVVIFDFFKDAQGDWTVLDGDQFSAPDDFRVESHALLCCELKQLYVAVTRAKRRVLFFDEDNHVGCRQLWGDDRVGDLDASVACATEPNSSSSASTPEAWLSQGKRLLSLGFAAQAEMCFARSGDDMLRCEAEATKLAKIAAASGARAHVSMAQLSGSKDKRSDNVCEGGPETDTVAQQFLSAAALFDVCSKPAHAGKCFAAAGDWAAAAERFRAAEHWNEAAVALLRAGLPGDAAPCFEKAGQWLQALKAWQSSKQPTQLMKAARKALEGLQHSREQILVFVRKALEALPDSDMIWEAALLLGAPQSDGIDAIIDFLANDMGAELAALRLLSNQNTPVSVTLTFRAFHRSVLRKDPAWAILSAMPGGNSRSLLMAALYGLEPPEEILSASNTQLLGPDDGSIGGQFDLGEGLTCVMVPKGSAGNLRQSLLLGMAWEVTLPAHVTLARRTAHAEETIKQLRGTGVTGGDNLLNSIEDANLLPKSMLGSLASRFAKDVWGTNGPSGPDQPVSARVASALIYAAHSAWIANQNVEQTFIILSAGGKATCNIFAELEGTHCHLQLVSYLFALRAGAICDAAVALLRYVESSAADRVPTTFIFTLASYLAGPATVLLQPLDGAYVLSSLLWDWPVQLMGDGLREVLPDLLDQLDSLPDVHAPESEYLREAALVQLAYSLGHTIREDWWEDSWSDAIPPVPNGNPATFKEQRSLRQQHRNARIAAGQKITGWIRRRTPWWRARQRRERWTLLCEVAAVVRGLGHVPTVDVASLLSDTSSFLRGEVSALRLRESAKETAGRDTELRRRAEGLKVREEAERTREVREQRREEKRRKGQVRQRLLEEKAAMLKKTRGGR